MTTIADNVIALQATVATLQTEVTALQASVSAVTAPTVDFTPVLTAIAGVAAELVPTPPAA